MFRPKYHVAIVGAGLGGLAAAIGIARAGHKVTIIEKAQKLGEVGAGIQVPPNSTRILERWGLLPQIEALSVRPKSANYRSYKDGLVLSMQSLNPLIEGDPYGVPYLHIHRADFHAVLVEEARRLGVRILLGSAVTGIDFHKPCVRIQGRPDFHADIIIGADGLRSVCREEMLGRKDPLHFTGDLAYRITVKASDMRKHPELTELANNPAINMWLGPRSHAVCYLLKGGDLYNIVLVCPDNLPESVDVAKADVQEMRDTFAGWDPNLTTLLGMVQEVCKWRLQSGREMDTWNHKSGKFALLGDACHATLPCLAQGAAMAVEDGAVLGMLFSRVNSLQQVKDALLIYEGIRKARTSTVVRVSTEMRDAYHYRDGPEQRERDRQLLYQRPFEGYPNPFADPVLQPWLFGYDAFAEAEIAWATYLMGLGSDTSRHEPIRAML